MSTRTRTAPLYYFVQGYGVTIKLDFKYVIFVIEDIDAATDAVKRLDGKTEAIRRDEVDLTAPKSPWRLLLESSGQKPSSVQFLKGKSERLREVANDFAFEEKVEVAGTLPTDRNERPSRGFLTSQRLL